MNLAGRWAGYLGAGTIIGIISGLFGIGGGILMVPLIVFAWGRDMHLAVGTSLAVMIPSAIAGTLRHHAFGNVDFALAGALAVGAVVGTTWIGVPLAEALPAETLKKAFGIVMIVSGLKMAGVFDYLIATAK